MKITQKVKKIIILTHFPEIAYISKTKPNQKVSYSLSHFILLQVVTSHW